ncbi:MAG: cytochrome c [Acidobacteria bacterium]|nr:cytochrome c [Acidobacteriota bacterium]
MTNLVGCPFSGRPLSWLTGAMLLILAIPAARGQAQQPVPKAETPPAETENVATGKRNFVTYACSACHGYSGQGSDSGPRIDTNRSPFPAFVSYVRQPGGSMPPYKTQSQISDSALADIYAFLKSVPPPPDPKSIPLLNDD